MQNNIRIFFLLFSLLYNLFSKWFLFSFFFKSIIFNSNARYNEKISVLQLKFFLVSILEEYS